MSNQNNNENTQNQTETSYSDTVKNKNNNNTNNVNNVNNNFVFPTQEQGLIAKLIDGVDNCEIIYKIGYIAGPQNVTFASKVNNKIYMFFTNKMCVDHVIKNRHNLKIDNHKIEVRPLISPTIRIIISNVNPIVPHSVVEKVLIDHKINLASPIHLLRAGFKNPDFTHVFGIRRQVFIYPDEEKPFPESILFEFANMKFRIFLTQDNISCSICKQEGHFASRCPFTGEPVTSENLTEPPPPNPTENPTNLPKIQENPMNPPENQLNKLTESQPNQLEQEPNPTYSQPTELECQPNLTNNQPLLSQNISNPPEYETTLPENPFNTSENQSQIQIDQTELLIERNPAEIQKRQLPSTSSTEELFPSTKKQNEPLNKVESITNPDESLLNQTKNRRKAKKHRSESPNAYQNLSGEEMLKSESNLKKHLKQHPEKYCVTFETLKDILDNTQGINEPIELVKDYVQNPRDLIISLRELHPFLETRPAKYCFTRLTTKLSTQLHD